MHHKRTAPFARFAIVSLAFLASLSPCSLRPAAAVEPLQQPAPRPLVTEPMTWLVRTDFGWEPAELAQPTLWIDGQPHTRMLIERGGEKALVMGK